MPTIPSRLPALLLALGLLGLASPALANGTFQVTTLCGGGSSAASPSRRLAVGGPARNLGTNLPGFPGGASESRGQVLSNGTYIVSLQNGVVLPSTLPVGSTCTSESSIAGRALFQGGSSGGTGQLRVDVEPHFLQDATNPFLQQTGYSGLIEVVLGGSVLESIPFAGFFDGAKFVPLTTFAPACSPSSFSSFLSCDPVGLGQITIPFALGPGQVVRVDYNLTVDSFFDTGIVLNRTTIAAISSTLDRFASDLFGDTLLAIRPTGLTLIDRVPEVQTGLLLVSGLGALWAWRRATRP